METTSAPNGAFQLILLAAVLIPAILFLLTEYNTLKVIQAGNRRMMPGLVWLQLIPFFGQVWQFIVVARIAGSIRRELESPRGDSIIGLSDVFVAEGAGRKPTLGIGIAYCTLNVLMIVFNLTAEKNQASMLVGLFALASMTCWIIYWVALAGYKKKLKVVALAI